MVNLGRVALMLGMLAVAPAGISKPLLTVTCWDSDGMTNIDLQESVRERLSGSLKKR